MTNQICRCGHEKYNHTTDTFFMKTCVGRGVFDKQAQEIECPCKKFEPQNQSQDKDRLGRGHDGSSPYQTEHSPDTRKGKNLPLDLTFIQEKTTSGAVE